MNTAALPPLVVIAGPTASGKSALAMALARTRPSLIINADSMQVYRDLRVLTARPSETDEDEVPHRLFGHVDGAHAYSAAEWATDARTAIAGAHDAALLPILVGGTGLYIRTLLDGIAPVPPIDPTVRLAVRALEVAEGHAALRQEDPAAAQKLRPTDTARVARALEVVRSTGLPLSHWQQRREGGIGASVRLSPIILDPPRNWLNDRIDMRFEAMVAEGCAEAARLRARILWPPPPVIGTIGVQELDPANLRDFGLETCVAAAKQRTRRYAKRQRTWFARQMPAAWPRVFEPLDNETAMIRAIILLDQTLTR